MNWVAIKRFWASPRRFWLKFYKLIVNDDGSPEYIARGWAIGIFIGSVIPIFCQLVISIPLAVLFRGSKIGATIGTMHTNPVTVVFIYPVQCFVGNRIIGGELSWQSVKFATALLVEQHDYSSFVHLSMELIISFFAGGLLMAAILTPIVYFGVLTMVRRYRELRRNRLKKGIGPVINSGDK